MSARLGTMGGTMGNRLTQIATRTGDNGTTGLGDNTRVSKDSLRVHAMGDVDELNSHISLLLCEQLPNDVRDVLVENISMSQTQKREFASVYQQRGNTVDGLIAALREKIAELDKQ